MYVWAIPVGHEVTPTRFIDRGASSTTAAAGAAAAGGAAASELVAAAVAAGAEAAVAAATSAVPVPWGALSRETSASTMRTTSASVVAAARAALKSFFISARASLGNICMWASPPPAGAAMRKTRVAGPSLAPQSMPSVLRPNTSEGSVIASLRACGMPMPPGRPVAILLSRSRTSARKVSMSVHRPLVTSC